MKLFPNFTRRHLISHNFFIRKNCAKKSCVLCHVPTLGTIISSRETLGTRLTLGTCHARQDSSANALSPKTEAAHKKSLAPICSISAAISGIPEKRLVGKECGLIFRSAAEIVPMAAMLKSTTGVFCRGEGGEVGEFSSWMNIYFLFSFNSPFHDLSFLVLPSPPPP